MRDTPNKYLVVKAKGGMGNRMLCALTGILYGQITGRKVIIDWRDGAYGAYGENVFSDFFSCPEVRPIQELPQTNNIRPAIWKGKLDKSMSEMIKEFDPDKHSSVTIHRKYSVDIRKLDYEEDIVVFWYYKERIRFLSKYLRDPKYGYAGFSKIDILRKMLREQLNLNEEIRQSIKQFKEKYWSDTVIGIHIRHTGEHKAKLSRYELPLRKFLEQSPKAYIFLCTDNREVSQNYHDRFDRVLSTPKWFPSSMASMHQNHKCPNRTANGVEALIDMYLLAKCDYLIYRGSSTFSWISYLLSDIPDLNAVDIERSNPKVLLKKLIRELVY